MATLLYGGAFNPITVAHLLTAREAMERGGFKEVVFIPTGHDTYKGGVAPFAHRLEMVKLAIKGIDGFDFSAWEGDRAKLGHKSYTIETYRYMRDHLAGNNVWWLIGSDNLQKIPKWKNFAAIKQEMRFFVLPRPGYSVNGVENELQSLGMDGRTVDTPLLEISSTYVRDRVKQGKCVRFLVPDAVDAYIKNNNLYKGE